MNLNAVIDAEKRKKGDLIMNGISIVSQSRYAILLYLGKSSQRKVDFGEIKEIIRECKYNSISERRHMAFARSIFDSPTRTGFTVIPILTGRHGGGGGGGAGIGNVCDS